MTQKRIIKWSGRLSHCLHRNAIAFVLLLLMVNRKCQNRAQSNVNLEENLNRWCQPVKGKVDMKNSTWEEKNFKDFHKFSSLSLRIPLISDSTNQSVFLKLFSFFCVIFSLLLLLWQITKGTKMCGGTFIRHTFLLPSPKLPPAYKLQPRQARARSGGKSGKQLKLKWKASK